MRKVTSQIVSAFYAGDKRTVGNTMTDGNAIYLHGNKIAEKREDGIYISNAGWSTVTTKERLNGLRGVSISQKNWEWFLNGEAWDGSWINITKEKKSMDTYTACSIVEGFSGEEHTEEEIIEAWQYLHDTGMAYKLQGWYGRTAQHLIEEGIINA